MGRTSSTRRGPTRSTSVLRSCSSRSSYSSSLALSCGAQRRIIVMLCLYSVWLCSFLLGMFLISKRNLKRLKNLFSNHLILISLDMSKYSNNIQNNIHIFIFNILNIFIYSYSIYWIYSYILFNIFIYSYIHIQKYS